MAENSSKRKLTSITKKECIEVCKLVGESFLGFFPIHDKVRNTCFWEIMIKTKSTLSGDPYDSHIHIYSTGLAYLYGNEGKNGFKLITIDKESIYDYLVSKGFELDDYYFTDMKDIVKSISMLIEETKWYRFRHRIKLIKERKRLNML